MGEVTTLPPDIRNFTPIPEALPPASPAIGKEEERKRGRDKKREEERGRERKREEER